MFFSGILWIQCKIRRQAWSTTWQSPIDRSIAIDVLATPGQGNWLINYWLFGQNLPTTNARWPFVGSKNAHIHSVYFKRKHLNCNLIFLSKPNFVIKNFQTSLVAMSHQKIFKLKSARFFNTDPRCFASSEGLNSSLAVPVGKLWLHKIKAIIVVLRSLQVDSLFFIKMC